MARFEVRMGGFGGQGIVTMAVVLGETVSLIEGKECVQTQSYGPEARGGASKSEVVISDKSEVDYPKVIAPDVFIALSRAAYLSYKDDLTDNGTLIVDEDLVEVEGDLPKGVKVYKIRATHIADNEVGSKLATNVVMLGAFSAITGEVTLDGLRERVAQRWPRFKNTNLKALELGFEAGKKAVEKAGNA